MVTSTKTRRAAVIGAGPIGLEIALRLVERGYEITVFEKGRIGEHIRQWAHVRFFSPLGMNLTPRMRKAIETELPADDSLLTGGEFVSRILEPLAKSAALRDRILTGKRVISIARSGLGKMGLPNHPLRSERSFRLLVEDGEGRETIHEADIVFDASGVYSQANWAGTAGMPAPGERRLNNRIVRQLCDFDGHDLKRWSGKKILLLGHGHSAANAVVALANVLKKNPATQLLWAVRSDKTKPVAEVPDDPLRERGNIVNAANLLAQHPLENLRVLRRTTVESFNIFGDSKNAQSVLTPIKVKLKVWKDFQEVEVDEIISLTGYRPDLEMLRELAADFSNVSEGARGLYRALTNVTDCLAKIEIAAKDLQSGEPNFFVVGVKSYGRNPGFLLQSGYDQLDGIFSLLP
jgi:thioredoxin reductase